MNISLPNWLTEMESTKDLPASLVHYQLGGYAGFGTGSCHRDNSFNWMRVRDYYIEHYGFPVLTEQVMNEMVSALSKHTIHVVLEVCAGSGWLSYHLNRKGVKSVATDDSSWESSRNNLIGWKNNHYCEVESIDAVKAINKYHDHCDCVCVSWPPYNDPIGYKIFTAAYKHNLPVLYIGEENGCCGDDRMWDFIYKKEDRDELKDEYICPSYTSWDGIHDGVLLYTWSKK